MRIAYLPCMVANEYPVNKDKKILQYFVPRSLGLSWTDSADAQADMSIH